MYASGVGNSLDHVVEAVGPTRPACWLSQTCSTAVAMNVSHSGASILLVFYCSSRVVLRNANLSTALLPPALPACVAQQGQEAQLERDKLSDLGVCLTFAKY